MGEWILIDYEKWTELQKNSRKLKTNNELIHMIKDEPHR